MLTIKNSDIGTLFRRNQYLHLVIQHMHKSKCHIFKWVLFALMIQISIVGLLCFLESSYAVKIGAVNPALRPSIRLSNDNYIPIYIYLGLSNKLKLIKEINILFGTYDHENQGEAKLSLHDVDNRIYEITFKLSELENNSYKKFALEPRLYIDGSLSSITGIGISIWQIHGYYNSPKSCIEVVYMDDTRVLPAICPKNQ